MRNIKSKASSASKRANKKLQTNLAASSKEVSTAKAAWEKVQKDGLTELEVRQATGSVEMADQQPDHHFLKTVLSEEQIHLVQDELFDFFGCDDLETWKSEMQTFFTGWVSSKMSEEMTRGDRGERVFSYHMIIKLMEKLAPIYPALKTAHSEQYRKG